MPASELLCISQSGLSTFHNFYKITTFDVQTNDCLIIYHVLLDMVVIEELIS